MKGYYRLLGQSGGESRERVDCAGALHTHAGLFSGRRAPSDDRLLGDPAQLRGEKAGGKLFQPISRRTFSCVFV